MKVRIIRNKKNGELYFHKEDLLKGLLELSEIESLELHEIGTIRNLIDYLNNLEFFEDEI